jgi:diacylglycerol O-acyltransferase
MHQLSPLDTSFIFNENVRCPQHVGNLSIFDPATAPGGKVRFKTIMQDAADRGHMVPYLRQRLIEVPFNADFPYWINEASFDPEFHIRHIALPEPGDWRQLCIQVSRIHARPLDRSRPLWEMYVIEGLDNVEGFPPGCYALYSKTHHACIDGSASSDVGTAFADLTPIPDKDRIPPPGPWTVDPVPTDAELLARANYHDLTKPLRLLETIGHTAPKIQKALEELSAGKLKLADPAPRTRFNGTASARRVFEGVRLDLESIKKIKNAVGGTVNDAVLGICSGALRAYLLEKEELPETSLVSLCPVNTRTEASDAKNAQAGNSAAPMSVALRTDIADAKERLQAICQETRNAKELTHAIGAGTLLEFAAFTPTALSAMSAKVAAEQGMANYIDPAFNTVTTNVPGPSFPIYSNGARLVATFGLGIVQDDVGLFHTISSYCDQVTISITSCSEMMPDPSHYADLLRASMRELELAFLGSAAPVDSTERSIKKPKTRAAAAKRKKAAAKKPRAATTAKTPAKAKTKATKRTAAVKTVTTKAK